MSIYKRVLGKRTGTGTKARRHRGIINTRAWPAWGFVGEMTICHGGSITNCYFTSCSNEQVYAVGYVSKMYRTPTFIQDINKKKASAIPTSEVNCTIQQ